jgi:hypothetical protein
VVKKTVKAAQSASPAQQLVGFIAKFDPRIARQIRAARGVLRKTFPTANELVYDNYNFFVIGYCTTERTSDCLFSLAADGHGTNLHFYGGSKLPDPHRILRGSGSQNRFLRLESAATLARPEVQTLLNEAVAQAKNPLPRTGRGATIIRSISAKQRPRRLAEK